MNNYMNFCYILVLGFLLNRIDCASFTWGPIRSSAKMFVSTVRAYDTTPDGTTHIVWIKSFHDPMAFRYVTISPNGTQVNKAYVDLSSKCNEMFDASLQVSSNGQYIVLAFDGALISEARDIYMKALFVESYNGGKTWSDPALIHGATDDGVGRIQPSVVLEESTGRVYATYIKGDEESTYGVEVCMKEPGEKSFGDAIEVLYPNYLEYPYITQTESGSQKYFTLIAKAWGKLFSSRSLDGKKWSEFVFVRDVRGDSHHYAAITDNKVSKGSLYIQYRDTNGNEQIIWSRDHGNTFEAPITVGKSYGNGRGEATVLALCGNGDQSLLFTAHRGNSRSESYIKFAVLHKRSFAEIPYPFKDWPTQTLDHDSLSCRYEGKGQYSVNFVVSGDSPSNFWYVHGTLSGI